MTTKPNALQALLGATTNVTKDVPVKRLGVNFTVKAISTDTLDQVNRKCTFGKSVDNSKLDATLIAEACVEPNFNDRSLIEHYEATDAADCVTKALFAGELKRIANAILEISGFGDEEIDFPN